MTIHHRYYLSGLLLLLAACGQDQLTEEPFNRSPYETVTITAGIPETRMTTEIENGATRFLWQRGDLITLATADQQLTYVTTNNGPSAIFYSASTNTDQPEDFLKNVEGKPVYARYPYNNRMPIDMDSLTTPIASGSPFMYAVDTISGGKLDLNFHHAMAYLRFHVKHDPFPSGAKMESGGKIDVAYAGQEDQIILRGNFDYKTQRIIPIETAGEMDIPYATFMDSVTLFPISPITAATEVAFELRCRTDEFYFHDRIDKQLPAGGLQAGHIYDIHLDFRAIKDSTATEEAMTTAKQKEYLEAVALEFMDRMPSQEFRELGELGRYFYDIYVDRYDWKNVETWGRDTFESLREALGTTTTDTNTENPEWSERTYTYNYYFTNYRAVLLASNFTGHFTAENGQWTLTPADDLQFIFKDQSEQECVIKLETSGEVKQAYLYNYDDWQSDNYTSTDTTYISNDYYDRTQCIIGVPEQLVISLTQAGSEVVKYTLNVDLGTLTDEHIDISTHNLSLSSAMELKNGYKIRVSEAAYEANKKASVNFELSNNRGVLVSAALAGDLSGIPSCNVDAFSSASFDDNNYNFDEANGTNAFLKLDIIGKVQMQGQLADVRQYFDYQDLADQVDNEETGDEYKEYINKANGLADVNLFYDGTATKQAAIKLEPFLEDDWGYTYWNCEPVLYFFDGSSYSAFEAFFNETEFKSVIDTFKKLANRYAELVKEEINFSW